MGWKQNGQKEKSTIIYILHIKSTDNASKLQYLWVSEKAIRLNTIKK